MVYVQDEWVKKVEERADKEEKKTAKYHSDKKDKRDKKKPFVSSK